MKGFGTDEKILIQVLSRLDPLQMAGVRATYTKHIGRDLYKDVKSETGGYLEQGLLAVIEGPLMYDVACAREAVKGAGTKEWLLNDILLGRSNADLHAIQTAYHRTYHRQLSQDVQDDLSFKTAELFKNVLRAARNEDSVPLNPHAIEAEVRTLHDSTAARMVNNVSEVTGIFARSSNAELREIDRAFQARYHTPLDKHVEKEFSGHMEDALLHMLRSATDPAMRDAILLEECMAGMGTKDEKLVVRVVRVHWDRQHKEMVKRAYRHRFGKDLITRVREETSGDYEKLMVALLE
jgi:annexin A7/11